MIRWGFEKQGLYQPKDAPIPVMTEGAPPEVDVYIDDGRKGEYKYQKRFWDCKYIWNRLSPDNLPANESPKMGVTNYLYVNIKNRGTRNARKIVAKAFQSKSTIPLSFPGDWKPLKTGILEVSEEIETKKEMIIGPFEWIPESEDMQNVLVSVSSEEDLSNIDLMDRTFPNWLLVPFDNNIAQRDLSSTSLFELQGNNESDNVSLIQKIMITNPYSYPIRLSIEHSFPNVPSEKISLSYFDNESNIFMLKPQEEKKSYYALNVKMRL